nr:keratin, type II cytoskeletal 1-like [Coffea arabica]XP_027120838.1 keratin, type II cytoskeletal 1-like [Coffea arabica]
MPEAGGYRSGCRGCGNCGGSNSSADRREGGDDGSGGGRGGGSSGRNRYGRRGGGRISNLLGFGLGSLQGGHEGGVNGGENNGGGGNGGCILEGLESFWETSALMVSMGEETNGRERERLRVRGEERETASVEKSMRREERGVVPFLLDKNALLKSILTFV